MACPGADLMVAIPDKDAKCRRIERSIASGKGVCVSCREEGLSEKTYHRWKKAQAPQRA